MSEIGVVVTRAVRIDREGARSLLRSFADWANRELVLQNDKSIKQEDVDNFLNRYADLDAEADRA